jgi:outer membrane protein assembly factor BamB
MQFFGSVAALLLLFNVATAGDWPQFRGPTGQGVTTEVGLPVEWDGSKNVVWMRPIPGKGWSSPIVQDRRIYLTTAIAVEQSGGDLSLEALCLDAADGKVIWEKEVFRQAVSSSPTIHSKNSHASATPLLSSGRLYVHFGHQGTACLDLAGNVIWRNASLSYAPVHGNGGSPILVNDMLVFNCDGGDRRFVAALDRETGKTRWLADRAGDAPRKFSFSTPLLIEANGKPQIISPGSDVVSALDPSTGREIWRVTYDGYSVVPRPVFGHGLVFMSTGFNNPSLLAIRPDGVGDVTAKHVAWRSRQGAPLTPSPLLVGDEVYLISDNGLATCLDARTGKVHWHERIGGKHSASPIFADGKVYCLSEDGVGIVLRAGLKYELLARNRLEEPALASYAAADGALFIRTEKHLYRLGRK